MQSDWIYRFDCFFLDHKNRILVKDRERLRIPAKAFNILVELVQSGGEVVTKDELLERVWPDS